MPGAPTTDATAARTSPAQPGGAAAAGSRPWAHPIVNWGVGVGAALPIVIGGSYLLAWFAGAAARWGAAGTLTMKANMALSLVLSGAALSLVNPRRTTRLRRAAGVVLASVVLLIGALTLYEHLFRADLGIDQLLAVEPPGAIATASPNRIGPPGSTCLTLLALGLLAVAMRRRIGAYFAIATGVVVLVPAVGYLFGIVPFYGKAATGIAWLSVVGLMALSVGLLLIEARDGALGLVWRDDPGGKLLRRLLPAAVLAPLAVQLLMRVGAYHQFYGHETGVGILLISLILVMSALLWRSALRLSAEAARARGAEQRAVSLARLPEENPDPVLRLNLDFEVAYANPSALSALRPLGIAVGRRAPPDVVHLAQRALAEGKRVEREVLAGDRSYSLSVVATGGDVNVYAHDITTRVRAEEALNGAMQRLESLLENSPAAVIEWSSEDFRISRWSDEATRMFGWTANEVLGKRIDELNWVYPEDGPLVEQVMADMLSGARPRNVSKNRNYRKDGTLIHCEWYNSTVADSTGKLVSVLSLVLDVTERKRIEQELRDANRAKDDFLAMLSHELRNPLAPIRNSTYVLERVAADSEQARRAKAVISRQTEHLTRIVDDLLDVTRIARGKIELRRSRVDLCEVVERVAEDFRPIMHDRGVRFEVAVAGHPISVEADDARVAQVVGNLLHNAAKYTRSGDSVVVSVVAIDGAAEIRVRDSGSGIGPELLPRIFEPFVQGERTLARTDGGLGLGLAVVKGIVELHGGAVDVRSAGKGHGAEFIVRLPVEASSRRLEG